MMNLKMTLRRSWGRLYHKMVREKASPEYIARGWAIGMFYGCLAPFGTQLILSIPTSFLLKGSKIGATFGTLLTNHFTVFVIYPAQCYVGNRLMGGALTYDAVCSAMGDVVREESWEALMRIGGELIASFFIGGAVLTAIMTPITYYAVLAFVRRYRMAREKKKQAV
ncbi:MAG: DUF2062 domain-containing protein [Lentisphaeria bacterium]|nr:DUF2062 domain-containing protein [Lentisphaeria bacterium]